ncbi:hypothetical protein V2J56_07360 [Georgenia sp. MJ206]|uniref:hypothetical protein n=1 Tax=Georgenia wangjunii TaxID=3117730 RepID=UPI002F261DAB
MTPSALFSRSGAARRSAGEDPRVRLVRDGAPGTDGNRSDDEDDLRPDREEVRTSLGAAPPSGPARVGLGSARSARDLGDGSRAPGPGDAAAPGAGASARARAVDAAAEGWREDLVELGGASTLSDVTLLGDAIIDLTAAHPSGIAQLYAGRTTRLSNLVREGDALVAARRSARTVSARTDELAQRYGVAPTYLAVGVATWTEDGEPEDAHPGVIAEDAPHPAAAAPEHPGSTSRGRTGSDAAADPAPSSAPSRTPYREPAPRRPRTVRAPVLLRPVRVSVRQGNESDFDIDLEPAIEVNPVVVRALRSRGIGVDVGAIARTSFTEHGFSPRAALHRIAALGEETLPDFSLAERIVIGPFVHPGQVLVEDLDAMHDELAGHVVVAALAGDEGARSALHVPLPPRVDADRAPQAERGVGDLDADQQRVIDAVASGAHLFVDAPPGSDVPGTVAAVLADATASGRRALYVPGTRRVGRALARTMDDLGLPDLVLDVTADARWRTTAAEQLRSGLTPVDPEIDDDAVHALRAQLLETRTRLAGYVNALHVRREPWGASAHAALQSLAALTAVRPGPRTAVRLPGDVLGRLVGETRDRARERVVRAGSLGAFELRPHDTPWYGARLSSSRAAHEALERVQRLAELSLPELRDQVTRAARETGLEPATTMREWAEQLRMLDGVRSALDVFTPQIFERSAADMVIATSTRAWRKEHGLEMRGRVRRRLRKQAKDLLRPGRPVEDLHGELVRVQAQREIWRRHCPAGGWPRLPHGMAEIERHARSVRADLDALDPVIGSGAGFDDLLDVPLGRLVEKMAELGVDGEALRLLPERTAVLAELTDLGLADLVADLAARRVPTAGLGAEFELAWWSSVLEEILRSDPALAGYDGPALVALAERFRDLDAQHVTSLVGPVRRAVARSVRALVREHREEAAQLVTELRSDHGGNLRQTIARHPRLAGAARPAWIVAPMLVPQLLPAGRTIDLLVLDGAQHLPVAQAVGAIARARQVVLVGDSRRGGGGLVGALAPLLPTLTLPTDRAEREESIADFLAEHGYGDVIRSVPAPPSGSSIRLDLVDGFGMPAPGADAVESVQTEVDHVVDLVIDHALSRPEESLAVVALNARHAGRVREAVIAAVTNSAALADFFDAARPEPFVVVDADGAAGLRRDAVILTLGFAKTPHGRVLHRFGPVSGPDGVAYMVDALDAVRRDLVVVSCIAPADLDRSRLKQPGPILLADLLERAESETPPADVEAAAAPDPLLVDLAERLWRLGLTVVPQYGRPDGERVPLAIGHPDLPGELLVAVLTDDAGYVGEPSLRRRDRHRVQRLTARGWSVHMAFSTAVFMDPQGEATTILAKVLDVVDARRRRAHPVQLASIPLPADIDAPDGAPGPDAEDHAGTGESDDVVDPLTARRTAGGAEASGAEHAAGAVDPHPGPRDGAADGGGPDDAAQVDAEPAAEAVAEHAAGRHADLGHAGSEPTGAEPGEGAPTGAELVDAGPTDARPTPSAPDPVRARGPRPAVLPGLPLAAYGDDQLDELAVWIDEDGVERTDAELVAELRTELGLTRRGAQSDAVLGAVAARRRR